MNIIIILPLMWNEGGWRSFILMQVCVRVCACVCVCVCVFLFSLNPRISFNEDPDPPLTVWLKGLQEEAWGRHGNLFSCFP